MEKPDCGRLIPAKFFLVGGGGVVWGIIKHTSFVGVGVRLEMILESNLLLIKCQEEQQLESTIAQS